MAKTVHDDVLDAMLNYIKNNATRISFCSAQPTTYVEAITTYKLGIKTITSGDFTGPANGDVSGRKVTSNQHTGVNADAGGTANHVALSDSVNSKLLMVTTCTDKVLNLNDSVTIPAWKMEIGDPS